MFILRGSVTEGDARSQSMMLQFGDAFRAATGEYLYPGTLNVKLPRAIPIQPQFRIGAEHTGELGQELLFEICRVNRLWAYRMVRIRKRSGRPVRPNGLFEIVCAQKIPGILTGCKVIVELLRDDVAYRPWERSRAVIPIGAAKRLARVEQSNRRWIQQAAQEEW